MSSTQYGPITATSVGKGNYTVSFMFTKVELYTIAIKLGASF